MKNKLKALFDYQKFEQNERLARLIEDTVNRTSGKMTELDDDDLTMVNAAGVPMSTKRDIKFND